MTPEDALELAKKQRPGIKLIVGAVEAREERIAPMRAQDFHKLPGDLSLRHMDTRIAAGFAPHPMALRVGWLVEDTTRRNLSRADWEFLQGATLAQINEFVKERGAA